MRKAIAAINMTIDGFCDHTAGIANDETHQHYVDLLSDADVILFGRKTFELMTYWQSVVEKPTGEEAMDKFALVIDKINKVVFSQSLDAVSWRNTALKKELKKEDILELKEKEGRDILVGSPSLIVALTKLGMIDEYQLALHPVILGKGLPLFKDITDSVPLQLLKSKTLDCGVIILYYAAAEPFSDKK